MDERFMIERQGKRFVLYAGLLDEAHKRGLRSIETELLQPPHEMNGHVCIVKARVRTEEGVFEGIGDASPENVGRNIAPHAIRMAETRAKARALRDAINIGVTALEELGGEDDAPASSSSSARTQDSNVTDMRQAQRQASNASSKPRRGAGSPNDPATRKQLNYLESLVEDAVADGISKFEEMVGKSFTELTREEASEWIGRLSGKAAP